MRYSIRYLRDVILFNHITQYFDNENENDENSTVVIKRTKFTGQITY